jgi:general L-amino acid transport system permease protein
MLTPPKPQSSPILWIKKNLFNTAFNTVLTVLCFAFLYTIASAFIQWLTTAQWSVVTENLRLFWVGRYPEAQLWRMWASLGVVIGLGITWAIQLNTQQPRRRQHLQSLLYILLPLGIGAIALLATGGLGLSNIRTSRLGGLFLTLFTAAISIALAFPFGILLALGRRSELPIIRMVSTGYIELVRGLPLIGILFMAQVMLPLVMPAGFRLDRLWRAIAGLTLFNAAYLAENIRAGLQAIPKGQAEAARSLGLNPIQTLQFIVLPQALRLVTPAIVGQFISLFKDTSLLALFALFELTGTARTVLSQPQFLGRNAEVYLFIGLIYWIFCFTMSRLSQRLEVRS